MPKKANGPRIETAGEYTQTGHDVLSAFGSQQQWPRGVGSLKSRRAIRQIELRGAGVKTDQHRIGSQGEGVVQQVASAGEIKHGMLVDRLLQSRCVVRLVVAF